ncbi:hypothetical protein Dda3937_04574 [Dickeya dadantii 3937]|uniref:Uncharacterized protein n=1 Tax=Dickeya dadantii (strain 3937) TaxID=198628 RepID=E0SB94_DICD3|nr:hypothetical protein Dda3937_04574 [Dickeya dadantii 3937]
MPPFFCSAERFVIKATFLRSPSASRHPVIAVSNADRPLLFPYSGIASILRMLAKVTRLAVTRLVSGRYFNTGW